MSYAFPHATLGKQRKIFEFKHSLHLTKHHTLWFMATHNLQVQVSDEMASIKVCVALGQGRWDSREGEQGKD